MSTTINMAAVRGSIYEHGFYIVSYFVPGAPIAANLTEVRDRLKRIKVRHTGWPAWLVWDKAIKPVGDVLEGSLIEHGREEPSSAQFWRASCDGRLFLMRGYEDDDAPNETAPGTTLSWNIQVWRIGECLIHAANFVKDVQMEAATVHFQCEWHGLLHRKLVRRSASSLDASNDRVEGILQIPGNEILLNLPEAVKRVMTPLCENFELFNPSIDVISEELQKMRSFSF